MASFAKPLKIANSTPAKASASSSSSSATTMKSGGSNPSASQTELNASEITSPHELIGFVDNLLEKLDNKFDDMSAQFIDRMNQMSSDVDKLETAIQDIINGDIMAPSVPQSPAPGTPGMPGLPGLPGGVRRAASANGL